MKRPRKTDQRQFMKDQVEDLQRRVTALEKAQGASAASQMGKLSRKHPTEAQRAASRANALKGAEAMKRKAAAKKAKQEEEQKQ